MALSTLTIVGRSLLARRFSTATTALSVGIAVALMLVLLSMRDSGQRAFKRGSGNMHLLVSADLSPLVSVLNGVFYARAPARALNWTQYLRIAQDPRLAFAIPVQQGDSYRGYPVLGTLPEFFEKFSPDPLFEPGQGGAKAWPFEQGQVFSKPFEVVAGYRVWSKEGVKLGDRLNLTHGVGGAGAHEHADHEFTVVGLLGPTGSPHDRALFVHLDGAWIIHAEEKRERDAEATGQPAVAPDAKGEHTEDAAHEGEGEEHAHEEEHAEGEEHRGHIHVDPEDLAPDEKLITGIYCRGVTREGSAVSAVIPTVASELRRDPRLTVAEPAAEVASLFRIVSNVDQILVAMAAVVMVSSGVAIMLALYNSMEQRRRQIAVLRVLGCSAWGICRIVMLEAIAIGLFGAALGVLTAGIGTILVAEAMRRRLGILISPDMPIHLLFGVVAGALLLAAAAGLIPAVMAYRTSVAKNLRPLG